MTTEQEIVPKLRITELLLDKEWHMVSAEEQLRRRTEAARAIEAAVSANDLLLNERAKHRAAPTAKEAAAQTTYDTGEIDPPVSGARPAWHRSAALVAGAELALPALPLSLASLRVGGTLYYTADAMMDYATAALRSQPASDIRYCHPSGHCKLESVGEERCAQDCDLADGVRKLPAEHERRQPASGAGVEWIPIENAPKDGTRLLLARFGDNEVGDDLGLWWAASGAWSARWKNWNDGVEPSGLHKPTHFMRIPALRAGPT